jgi:hypothetical protein
MKSLLYLELCGTPLSSCSFSHYYYRLRLGSISCFSLSYYYRSLCRPLWNLVILYFSRTTLLPSISVTTIYLTQVKVDPLSYAFAYAWSESTFTSCPHIFLFCVACFSDRVTDVADETYHYLMGNYTWPTVSLPCKSMQSVSLSDSPAKRPEAFTLRRTSHAYNAGELNR